jgi:hypothetical protein
MSDGEGKRGKRALFRFLFAPPEEEAAAPKAAIHHAPANLMQSCIVLLKITE